jgi:hypothetical protein
MWNERSPLVWKVTRDWRERKAKKRTSESMMAT